jgi:nitrilase
MEPRKIRVAVAQCRTLSTRAETMQSLESFAKRAAENVVGLLLFPEAILGGYPRECSFGMSIGHRQDIGREQFLKYFDEAIDLGDTLEGAGSAWADRSLPISNGAKIRGDGTREELERIAKETGVFLAIPLIEKTASTLYCATALVCPKKGMLPNKRRKVMPTGTERLVWAQGNPNTLKAVTVNIQGFDVTIGTAICWENYMPLLRYSLYAQDVNIWLAPTADGRDTWLPLMQTIAFEGRAFVLSCNQVTQRGDLPAWINPSTSKAKPVADPQPEPMPPLRRTSTIQQTIEGHEICWPECKNDSPSESEGVGSHQHTQRSRRKSSIIKSETGIELCLPYIQREKEDVFAEEDESRTEEDESRAEEPDTNGNQAFIRNGYHSQVERLADFSFPKESYSNASSAKVNTDEMISRGGSCIVSPFGKVLEGPFWGAEGLLVSEIDLDDCVKGKLDFDVAGHYSRSDSFKLTVAGLEL